MRARTRTRTTVAVTATVIGLAAASAGCKKSRADKCRELADQTIMLAEGLSRGLGGKGLSSDEKASLRAEASELEKQCLTWPPEVFACMEPGANPDSPKCREAEARMNGQVPGDVDRAPDGPPVAAKASLGEAPFLGGFLARVADDGTLYARVKDGLVAVGPDGKERWRAGMEGVEWFIVDGKRVLTAGDDDTLVALDAATGAELWRRPVPKPAEPEEYEDYEAEGAVVVGGAVLVATSDARFLRLTDTCPKGEPAPCFELAFALADEELDTPDLAVAGDDLVIGESTGLRRLTTTGKTVGSVFVRDTFGGFAVTPKGTVAASMDDELVLLDLAACGPAKVALPRKRDRDFAPDDEDTACDTCVAPPAGCAARVDLKEVDAAAPRSLADGSIAVTYDEGVARVAADGTVAWKSAAPVYSGIAAGADVIYGLASGVGDDLDDAPAAAVAIDAATGALRWKRQLDVKLGFVADGDMLVTGAAGRWLVLGYKGETAWIELP
jgi:hypothetical protein